MIAGTAVVSEGLVRLLLVPPGLHRPPEETPLIREHRSLGYALRPNAAGHYTAGGRRVPIRTNERGFRDGPFSDATRAELRILAVGDSFTLGLGVDATDPWPERLETTLRRSTSLEVAVLNAGVPGYSARQMRELAQLLLPEFKPQLVVFGLDSETYWRVEAPYVLRAGQLVMSAALPDLVVGRKGLYSSSIRKWRWLHRLDIWLNQHFELGAHLLGIARRLYGFLLVGSPGYSPPRPSLDELRLQLEPMLEEVRQMRDIARGGGVEFVVLLINPQARDGGFDGIQHDYNRVVTEACDAAGISVVDPMPVLIAQAKGRPLYRSADDYHWTREAHRVAAAEIHSYLSRERWLKTSPGASGL